MKFKIVTIIICGFLFFFTTAATASQLIVNSGFETGDFTGWNVHSPPVFDGSITTADAHSGTYSLAMGAVDWIDQAFASVATTGDLSFWVKGTGFSGPSNITVLYSDTTSDDLTIGGSAISTTEWRQFTINIDNTKLVNKITVSVGESEDILFDDFSLEGQNAVPEPATILFFGLGLLGIAGVSRKKEG
nr:PEP-CTERM sorting domain-containing protein [uncultured Desulfobacter sp.]